MKKVFKDHIIYKCNVRFYILCESEGYKFITYKYYVINVTTGSQIITGQNQCYQIHIRYLIYVKLM
jgi:hypothetical protein